MTRTSAYCECGRNLTSNTILIAMKSFEVSTYQKLVHVYSYARIVCHLLLSSDTTYSSRPQNCFSSQACCIAEKDAKRIEEVTMGNAITAKIPPNPHKLLRARHATTAVSGFARQRATAAAAEHTKHCQHPPQPAEQPAPEKWPNVYSKLYDDRNAGMLVSRQVPDDVVEQEAKLLRRPKLPGYYRGRPITYTGGEDLEVAALNRQPPKADDLRKFSLTTIAKCHVPSDPTSYYNVNFPLLLKSVPRRTKKVTEGRTDVDEYKAIPSPDMFDDFFRALPNKDLPHSAAVQAAINRQTRIVRKLNKKIARLDQRQQERRVKKRRQEMPL